MRADVIDAGGGPRLAIVMKGYPRLSETFIAQELLSLQRRGIEFSIWALRHPTDGRTHAVHDAIHAPVHYLPEYLHHAPLRVLRAWWRLKRDARARDGYRRARRAWLDDLRRDFTANRIRRWGQALVLACELPGETRHLYVHFLHTPGSVTRYAAMIRGLTWSASAHAKDIYTQADWEKARKIGDLDWLVTCTAANVEHLRSLAPEHASKISLVYHGLDLERFSQARRVPSRGDGSDAGQPLQLLSVGRAVAKKGFDVLLDALAALPADLAWRLTHIGGGELRDELKQRALSLGLGHRIEWLGARTQTEVLEAYRRADLFVLASRIADDGDRDGLPNVLMEAQSQGLACVSTNVSGVPELVIDGETGILVPPGDPVALSRALDRLIRDPGLRRQLGEAGAARVRQLFDHEVAVDRLASRLRGAIAVPRVTEPA